MAISLSSPRTLLLCPFLIISLLYSLSSHTTTAQGISNYSIPFYTYGPHFVNSTAVAHVNASVYNHSLPPVNWSLPVLRLAGVITLTGADTTNTALVSTIYPFMVDMINAKGGLIYNNTQYLLSLTWASDDSSPNYLQLIYSQWLNDPIAIFLTPATDAQYQLLLPLIEGTNRTWMNLLDADPANFASAYPYTFTITQAKNQVVTPIVVRLNQRAQEWAEAVQTGTVNAPQGTLVNPYGLTSICMYTHNDTAQIELCDGIRIWMNSTNTERAAAGATPEQMVSIVTDVFWGIASTVTDQGLYQSTLELCPDDVDLLAVCGEQTEIDMAAVADSMAAIQLRPKAAYTSSTFTGFNPANATLLDHWEGWVTHGSIPLAAPASLPLSTFDTAAAFTKAYEAYYPNLAAPSSQPQLYSSAFDVIKAALYKTASLESPDLRQAFLSLSGTTYLRSVGFDPITGVNDLNVVVAEQIQGAAIFVTNASSQVMYPYNWPWSRVQVGDALTLSQSVSPILIGVVMAVLGCWVAQIIVEQAVFVRRRGEWYQLWLLLVAAALAVAGVWCSQFNMTTAVTVTIPNNGQPLALSWSLWIGILALLPAVLLSWSGLMVLMRDVENVAAQNVSKASSAAQEARQRRQEQENEKRKRAALSHVAHFFHLRDSITWNVPAGGILISVSMWLTRLTLTYAFSCQATFVVSPCAWIISAVLCVFLVCPAMLMYYHALKWRVWAVFALAVASIVDWQVHINMGAFTYQRDVLFTPSALYTVLLSSTAVTVICGVICAITCFGFVGLQFSRMQLSRNGLSVLVASLESVINKLRHNEKVLSMELVAQRGQSDQLAKLLECINILLPIPKEYAFAMASQSNTSTMAMLYNSVLEQAAAPQSTVASIHANDDPSRLGSPAEVASPLTVSGRRLLDTRSPCPAPSSALMHSRPSGNSIVAIAVKATSNTEEETRKDGEEDGELVDRDRFSREDTPDDSRAMPPIKVNRTTWDTEDSAPTGNDGTPTVTLPPTEVEPQPQPGRLLRIRGSSHRQSVDLVSSQLFSAGETFTTATCPMSPVAEKPDTSVEHSVNSFTHVSSAHEWMDHAIRCKQYDSDVLSVLAEQSVNHSLFPPPSTVTTTTIGPQRKSHSETTEFSLYIPSLAGAPMTNADKAAVRGSSSNPPAAGTHWPIPSLLQLLQHPVCVELLKDELERIHSVELLLFFLHAVRYRRLLTSSKARRAVALQLYSTFIAEHSEQQINISTRQRDAIAAAINKNKEDACTSLLFSEAEREVAMLIEQNVMKTFQGTTKHRLAVWVYHACDMRKVLASEHEKYEKEMVSSHNGMWLSRTSKPSQLEQSKKSITQSHANE